MIKIQIDRQSVHGINHPLVWFEGRIDNQVSAIIFENDKQEEVVYELPINEKPFVRSKTFLIKQPLEESKYYNIYGVLDGQKYLIDKMPAEKWRRIYYHFLTRLQSMNKPFITKDKKHGGNLKDQKYYHEWIAKNEHFLPVKDYDYQPLISFVMPVYNVKPKLLKQVLDSMLNQTYQNFEICIADDNSNKIGTLDLLKQYERKDSRIKVVYREVNGHISNATNSALSLASGEFIALVDNDDLLSEHALNEMVYVLNKNPNLDLIYSDEDKIDLNNVRSDPTFKPDYCPDTFHSGNYICHFTLLRKTLVDKVGGFKTGVEGAQDFDLFLRVLNETNRIHHIPKILYHWRMIEGSTALASSNKNYAGEAGKQALLDYFGNKQIPVDVNIMVNTHYFIDYLLLEEPKVYILVNNTIDGYDHENVIESEKNALYHNYEIFEGDEKAIYEFALSKKDKEPNSYLVLLSGDCKVKSFDWLNMLVGYASQKNIGIASSEVIDRKQNILESFYVLNSENILSPQGYKSFEYGEYGSLLTTKNTLMTSSKLVCLQASLFDCDFNLNYEMNIYNLSLNLISRHYRNVFIPLIKVETKKVYHFKKDDISYLMRKYPEQFNYDCTYNRNLSSKDLYRLD